MKGCEWILLDKDLAEIKTLMKTSSLVVKEGVLTVLKHLVIFSKINCEKLLINGFLPDLLKILQLGATPDLQREAAKVLAKLAEVQELSHLWLAPMTSAISTLYKLLSSHRNCVRAASLKVLASLSKTPSLATKIYETGTHKIFEWITCKTSDGHKTGNTDLQTAAMKLLNNIVSHRELLDKILSEQINVLQTVADLLEYGACFQQKLCAQFISLLSVTEDGLNQLITINGIKTLLWSLTCSHCRQVRECASQGVKNILSSYHSKEVLNVLEDVGKQAGSASTDSTAALLIETARWERLSLLERGVNELASVLVLVYRVDALSNHPAAEDPTCSKGLPYTSSLQVLSNTMDVFTSLVTASSRRTHIMNETSELDTSITSSISMVEAQTKTCPVLTHLCTDQGVLKIIEELSIFSKRLAKVNPPPVFKMDPQRFPPRDVSSSKSRLASATQEKTVTHSQAKNYRYSTISGFDVDELQLVRKVLKFLIRVTSCITPEYFPNEEESKLVHESPRKEKKTKKKMSFKKSAKFVSAALRLSPSARRDKSKTSQSRRGSNLKGLKGLSSSRGSIVSTDSTFSAQDTNIVGSVPPHTLDTINRVRQALLESRIVQCLAPWISCGIHDIQADVITILRYLLYNDVTRSKAVRAPSSPSLARRASSLLQSNARNAGIRSRQLAQECARQVLRHCGAYLRGHIQSFPTVYSTTVNSILVCIKNIIDTGESSCRVKLSMLGYVSTLLEFIRVSDERENLQSLGLVALRALIGSEQSMKELLVAHGGMSFLVALHEYKTGIVKEHAAANLQALSKNFQRKKMSKKISKHTRKQMTSSPYSDIWEQVSIDWKRQDKVGKVFKKWNLK